MAKDPAFLFYPQDFTTGTQFFTNEQTGKYIRLLLAQHQHGHLSEKQVILICESYDNEVMSKFVKDEYGLWFNQRLEIEIDKRKNFIGSRSKNKLGKKHISKSYEDHMENENENINEINTGSSKLIETLMENSSKTKNNLIGRMIQVFMLRNPEYYQDEGKDREGCIGIAEKIGKVNKWPPESVYNGKMDLVINQWVKVADFIKADKFYNQQSLKTINNGWQKLWQSFCSNPVYGAVGEQAKFIEEQKNKYRNK